MQLAILIAILAALAQGEAADARPVNDPVWRLGLTAIGMMLAPLAAAIGSIALTPGRAILGETNWRSRMLGLRQAALGLWLGCCGLVLYVAEWPLIVRSNWALGDWLLVDELCILTPIVLPLLWLWLIFAQIERAGDKNAVDGSAPVPLLRISAAGYVWLQARQHLGLILLPALAVIAVQDLYAGYWPEPAAESNSYWICLPLVAGLLVLSPVLLRGIWRTSPLPAGELRTRLTAICREVGCPMNDILIWHTDATVANAAVAGLFPRLRYVFLTDGLLLRLSDDQLAAVLRHELGHVVRQHLPLRMLLLTLPIVLFLAGGRWLPLEMKGMLDSLAAVGVSESLQASLLLPLLVAGYAILVVGRYSRWLEHDADLAVIWSRGKELDAATGEHFSGALQRLVRPGRESRAVEWLHPSIEQRVAFLRQVLQDPAVGQEFRRRVNVAACLLVGAYILTVLCLSVG